MRYRIELQFEKPENSENWEPVSGRIFNTDMSEEEIDVWIRRIITFLGKSPS